MSRVLVTVLGGLRGGAVLFLLVWGVRGICDAPVSGFSHLTFSSQKGAPEGDKSGFAMGGLDFYYTRAMTEKTSFLFEVVYEFSEETNEAVLDVERAFVKYEDSNWFKVIAGRTHTSLGYWNDTFHHGSWLQTTIDRPLMYLFEDDGGLLPVHSVGLEVRGDGKVGPGTMGYALNVANGRGPVADPPQLASDANNSHAYNLALYYEFPQADLRVGTSYYIDHLPDDTDNLTAPCYAKGEEVITTFHLVWQPAKYELLTEYSQIQHNYAPGSKDANGTTPSRDTVISVGYVQFAYKTGRWQWYYRNDFLDADKHYDSYFANNWDRGLSFDGSGGFPNDKGADTLGARYDLSDTTALKAEHSVIGETGAKDLNISSFNWSYAW